MSATSPTPPPVLRSAMKHSPSMSPLPLTSPTPTPYLASPPVSYTPTSFASSSGLSTPQTYPGYTPKVSFDNFDSLDNPSHMFSFTLNAKSQGYRRKKNTRVFLCASSPDESGREALDWALESLVQDGDELVVYRGLEEDVLEQKDHDLIRDEAREFMKQIEERSVEINPDRKLSLILEYVPGKITDTLDRLIALYRPDSVVVGTRGRRPWQNMGMGLGKGTMGSVSRYCLSHSPVPIIVVRPERKVKKAVEKRKADPKRGTHFD